MDVFAATLHVKALLPALMPLQPITMYYAPLNTLFLSFTSPLHLPINVNQLQQYTLA